MTRTTYDRSLLWIAALCVAGMAIVVATSCATISDPPMPAGRVSAQQVLDWQQAMADADEARSARKMRLTRWANIGCQIADTAVTLIGVNLKDRKLAEANGLLPDPYRHPGYFIGVKLSLTFGIDRAARRGYHTPVRLAAGATCAAAGWNLSQVVK